MKDPVFRVPIREIVQTLCRNVEKSKKCSPKRTAFSTFSKGGKKIFVPDFCPMGPGKPYVASLFPELVYSNSMVATGFSLTGDCMISSGAFSFILQRNE